MKAINAILRERIIIGVYSNHSADAFRSYLVEKIKLSDKFEEDCIVDKNSLIYISKKFNWIFFPPSPWYSISIKLDVAKKESDLVAIIVLKGNKGLSSFKYFILFFWLIMLSLMYFFDSLFSIEPVEIVLSILGPLVFALFCYSLNKLNILKACKETKELLVNEGYDLKIID